MNSVKKILIVRLSAIGDIVFASPLIGAIRRRYPGARISWLVQPETRDLLAAHPDLDELIVWQRQQWQRLMKERRWFSLWSEIRDFRRTLRSHRFDFAIDAQGLLKSGFLTWLSGADERIGLGSKEGSRWLMTKVVDRGGESKRIGSEYLHLAQQMDLPTDHFEMEVVLNQEDDQFALDLIRSHGLGDGYFVICPFTTRPQKHWFEERWIELISRLYRVLGLPVMMLGGPGDQEAADRIECQLDSGIINQVGTTSLTQAAALIKRCALLIGVDTGLTHMGIAFNRPTLALFGSTCPYLDTARDNAKVIYHKLDCSPCKRNPTCENRFDCMSVISVDEVLAEATRLLQPALSPT